MAKKSNTRRQYPKCAQLVLCDALFIDPNSAKPNLFGLFDSFKPRDLPSQVQFAVFVKLCGGNGKFPLSISLLDPTGSPVEGATLDIKDFECKPDRTSKIGGMLNVVLKKKGPHKLVVRTGQKTIVESMPIPVEVKANNK